MIKLVDITAENWLQVLFLTTNENEMPTLCEEFVASNALSLVQAQFEEGWITKAVEAENGLVGFVMYGYCAEHKFYELCRVLIDKKYQKKGYGTQAIGMVLEEMKKINGCEAVYLSTDPENVVGKRLYERLGFRNTGVVIDGEEQFSYRF